jgi:ribose transport system ATP-binding protein
MISSELPEMLRHVRAIVSSVMCEGRVTGELSHAEATQEKILELAMAKHRQAEEGSAVN